MSTQTTDARPTEADRIRDQVGDYLPAAAVAIFHDRELKARALQSDARISDQYRREQLAALDTETEAALFAAQEREVAAAMKELDQREGAILGQIKGTAAKAGVSIETSDEQRERHFRASREATTLLADLMVAQTLTDPDALRDLVEEAIESGRADRVRRLAPVALAQLAQLEARNVAGADGARAAVFGAWDAYQKTHPSLVAQLRAIRAERAAVAQPFEQKYQRARRHFTFGAAKQGMRF